MPMYKPRKARANNKKANHLRSRMDLIGVETVKGSVGASGAWD